MATIKVDLTPNSWTKIAEGAAEVQNPSREVPIYVVRSNVPPNSGYDEAHILDDRTREYFSKIDGEFLYARMPEYVEMGHIIVTEIP